MHKIEIANRWLGLGEPCFIIAEAGVNHNGDIRLAKKLIDVAKYAGADAVKFQTFQAEEVVTRDAQKANYQIEERDTKERQLEMLKRLELDKKDFKELFDYARKKKIIFLSTPVDRGSVDLLDKLGVEAYKVGSAEITNFPFLKYIAKKAKPVILSTGMATLDEARKALEVIQQDGLQEVILLHCVTAYPAKTEDMNLRAMDTLRKVFNLPVGLSDHTLGITVPIAATALGACVIEKHFTLDKKLPGPDHKASLGPEELRDMVRGIKEVGAALGDGLKRPTKDEENISNFVRRSVVAKIDIPKGTTITGSMLAVKRPGVGIEPKHIDTIIGRKTKRGIKRDELINWDMV